MTDTLSRRRFILSLAVPTLTLAASPALAQSDWLKRGQDALKSMSGSPATKAALSDSDIVGGLREALKVGTERVVGQLGRADGFNKDPAVHIPLPDSFRSVQKALGRVGMSGMLDDLELRLNRGAEAATPKAKRLFWDAIGDMTLDDARTIYEGPEDSATRYFQGKMTQPLKTEMRPIVDATLNEVGAIKSYDSVMTQYRSMPFVPDVKADLTDHVLVRALDGIFAYLAREEASIRSDPAKRTTDILKKVFGAG